MPFCCNYSKDYIHFYFGRHFLKLLFAIGSWYTNILFVDSVLNEDGTIIEIVMALLSFLYSSFHSIFFFRFTFLLYSFDEWENQAWRGIAILSILFFKKDKKDGEEQKWARLLADGPTKIAQHPDDDCLLFFYFASAVCEKTLYVMGSIHPARPSCGLFFSSPDCPVRFSCPNLYDDHAFAYAAIYWLSFMVGHSGKR